MTARLPPAYLRQPTLQGDTIVFVSDDDLWRVAAGGGTARRLTAGLRRTGHALPVARRPVAGLHRPRRSARRGLAACRPGRRRPAPDLAGRRHRGARLDTRGPHPLLQQPRPALLPQLARLHAGRARRRARARWRWARSTTSPSGRGGQRVIGRNTADPARWKRYRGGTAGHLWIDARGDGQFRRMTELQGNITSPMWLGERIYFLSDFEGIGNLYSCLPDGSDLRAPHRPRRATTRATPAATAQRIVYQCGAELWLFDPASDSTQPIDIDVPAARTQAARRFVPAAEHLHGVALHPAGHSVAVEVRGKLFSDAAVGRRGAPARPRRRVPASAWASGWPTAARWWRSATPSGEEQIVVFNGWQRTRAALGHRPRHRAARGAAGHAARHRQPPQPAAAGRRRQRHAAAWPTAAPAAASTTWRGRPAAAGSPMPSTPARATPRSSCCSWPAARPRW